MATTRPIEELRRTVDPRVYCLIRRRMAGKCTHCPPNGGWCNRPRLRTDRYKQHRRA